MEEEHLLTGHNKSVLALVLDEPRSRLYSSSTDATVRAWDLADMNCLAVIKGHSKPVTHLQLLGGRLLFTAAGGGIRVWCTKLFVCLAKIKTSYYSGAIRSMLVSMWIVPVNALAYVNLCRQNMVKSLAVLSSGSVQCHLTHCALLPAS